MSHAFIRERVADCPIPVMCEVLGVSRSGHYAWASRLGRARAAEDRAVAAEIGRLRRELDRVRMERDILKQAALIFGKATGRR